MTSARHGAKRRAAFAGAVGACVALAVGEVVATLVDAMPSPLVAVGDRFVDRFAGSLEDFAVTLFGTNDKAALVAGTVVIAVVAGAATGRAALSRGWVPWAVFGVFGTLGAWAQGSDSRVGAGAAIAIALVSVVAGAGATTWLVSLAADRTAPTESRATSDGPAEMLSADGWSRRRFVAAGGAALAVAAGLATAGRALAHGDVVGAAKAVPLPRPLRRRTIPDTTELTDAGVSPYVTPNADFYRIDTALIAPRVDAAGWRLRVAGLVERPFTIGYEELLSLDSVEEIVTLQCVSNEVGGDLVGNAAWQGVPLKTLLDRAAVKPGAEQVFSRSVDGWTSGFPLSVLDGERPVLVAYAMNGRRLPVEHGFPARLVVSGLYGYVSATKWLNEIELTTWDGATGYWVPRGWSKKAPIKLASRVDVPRTGARLDPGPTVIGGVAWLPDVGVKAVEVSLDDGPWRQCRLAPVASEHTWVQWTYRWEATSGRHDVRVRAVDQQGRTQVQATAPPAPDGATGYHRVEFEVSPG